MSLLLTDVAAYLEAQGIVGGATGWAIFKSDLPPRPDKVIAVFDTPGIPDPELKPEGSTEVEYDLPGFQIRGRGAKDGYEELRAKLGEVYRALHGSSLGSTDYVYVNGIQSGPLPMGKDGNDRPELTWNFVAMRRRDADS